MLIKFKVRGILRFLSHAEMIRVFQRACVRAAIKVLYSEGFNPHLRLSLPLPRSVGIEVDDDLLCLKTETDIGKQKHNLCNLIKIRLSEQLPSGFELLTVMTANAKASIQPRRATYLLAVEEEYLNEKLKNRIKYLLESESLNLQRRTDPKNLRFKNIDVRPFLKSIRLDGADIAVECKIGLTGSIRVDEIMELLELDYGMLSAPIRRKRVHWQLNES